MTVQNKSSMVVAANMRMKTDAAGSVGYHIKGGDGGDTTSNVLH